MLKQDTFIHGVKRVVIEQPETMKDENGYTYTRQRISVFDDNNSENRIIVFSNTGEAFTTEIK